MTKLFTLQIVTLDHGIRHETTIDDCTSEEIEQLDINLIRALSNKRHFKFTTGDEFLIFPYSVLKKTTFSIICTDVTPN